MCLPGCEQTVRHALSRRGFFAGAAGFAAAAALPPAAIAAPRSFSSVVDLTHTMSAEFPTYLGVPGIEMQRHAEFKKDGYNMYWWRLLEHAGTHVDAPIHFSESGASAEKIPVDSLVVPLAVIDVAETTVTDVAAVPPIVTPVAPVKPVPVMVSLVPPVAGPALGEIAVTVGAAT